jgi:hypothetical protein
MDAVALFTTLAWLRAVGWLLARALIQYRACEMLEPADCSRPLLATVRFELPFWTTGALCLVGAGIVHRFMREPPLPEAREPSNSRDLASRRTPP